MLARLKGVFFRFFKERTLNARSASQQPLSSAGASNTYNIVYVYCVKKFQRLPARLLVLLCCVLALYWEAAAAAADAAHLTK